MRVLQVVQKSFDSIGFDPKLKPFNRIILSMMAIHLLNTFSLWIFLLLGANSSHEFMESIYITSCYSGIFLSAANVIFTREELFSVINMTDGIFNESK